MIDVVLVLVFLSRLHDKHCDQGNESSSYPSTSQPSGVKSKRNRTYFELARNSSYPE